MAGFLRNITLKEYCYSCSYKGFMSGCDITLCDFWGAEVAQKDMDDNKGLSGIIVSTEKGKHFLESFVDLLEIRRCEMETIIKFNRNICEPSKKSPLREGFYTYIEIHGREAAISNFLWEKKNKRVKRLVQNRLRDLYRKVTGKEKTIY
jgi:hypothetical protein